jgi:hypothetical protein
VGERVCDPVFVGVEVSVEDPVFDSVMAVVTVGLPVVV